MKKSIQWRLGLIALSVLVALFLFLPSTPLTTKLPDWWHQSVPKISLGLDLRGGSHIVMQVETDKAVESSVDNIVADLQTTAASQRLAVTFSRNGQDITAKFAEPLEDKVEKLVKGNYAILDLKTGGKGELVYAMKPAEVKRLKETAVTPGARADPAQDRQVRRGRARHLQAGAGPDRAPASGREEPPGGHLLHQDRGPAGVQARGHGSRRSSEGAGRQGPRGHARSCSRNAKGRAGKIIQAADPGVQTDAPDRRPSEGGQGRHRPV